MGAVIDFPGAPDDERTTTEITGGPGHADVGRGYSGEDEQPVVVVTLTGQDEAFAVLHFMEPAEARAFAADIVAVADAIASGSS